MVSRRFIIQSIKPIAHKKGLYNVFLGDDFSLEIDEITLSDLHLYSGKSLDHAHVQQIQKYSELQRLKKYCYFILSKKMYTVSEIKNKLVKRCKDQEQIKVVIEDLLRLKLLNDEEYARLFLRSMVNKQKYSPREIRQKFFQKGLSAALMDDAMIDSQYELSVALKWVEKKTQNPVNSEYGKQDRQKLYAFLLRKGFSPDVIHTAIFKG